MPTPPLMSSCELRLPLAAAATCCQLTERSGTPRTLNPDSPCTMSGAAASRRLAATCFAFSFDLHGLGERVHAAPRGRAAAEGAHAVPDQRGVALDDAHHLHGDLELVGHQLGEGRLVPLAVRGGSREHGHVPVVGHHEIGDLRLLEAADLDIGRHADAREAAAGPRRLLRLPQGVVAGPGQRVVEGARVFAAVVTVPEGRRVGNLSGGMKLRRRTSDGSRSTLAASRSMPRSMKYAASGRPAPR